MRLNGKIYIAFTCHVFGKYIFEWLGSVHDCYVLQSWSVISPFKKFDTSYILKVVNDSNEDEIQGASDTSKTAS